MASRPVPSHVLAAMENLERVARLAARRAAVQVRARASVEHAAKNSGHQRRAPPQHQLGARTVEEREGAGCRLSGGGALTTASAGGAARGPALRKRLPAHVALRRHRQSGLATASLAHKPPASLCARSPRKVWSKDAKPPADTTVRDEPGRAATCSNLRGGTAGEVKAGPLAAAGDF